MSEPLPAPRTRRTSDEAPAKPIPRARRVKSPPSMPPPPPPSASNNESTSQKEETDSEQTNAITVNHEENSKEQKTEVNNQNSTARNTPPLQYSPQERKTSTTSQEKLDMTDNDDKLPSDLEEDEHDYMNLSNVEMRPSKADKNDAQLKRRSRPLSNYSNVAPLPEPMEENSNTKTVGQTTNVDSKTTEGVTEEDSPSTSAYRFKPKYRAPARPPPGYKKLPPADNALVGKSDDLSSEEVVSDSQVNKGSSSITRNRPAVRKMNSIPPTVSPVPPKSPVLKTNIPLKPPRSRQKHQEVSPSASPTPPPLVHPVVIPSADKSLHSLNSSSLLTAEERQPSDSKINLDKPHSPVLSHLKSPGRKAPVPPPNKDVSNKTPPSERKISSNSPEVNKASPSGARKAVRVAPPPPKPSKSCEKINPESDVVKVDSPVLTSKPIKENESEKSSDVLDEHHSSTRTPPTIPKPYSSGKILGKQDEGNSASVVKKVDSPTPDAVMENKDKDSQQQKEEGTNVSDDLNTAVDAQSSPVDSQRQQQDEVTYQSIAEDDTESVLSRMNLFTVEMRKVDGQGFGLHIAEGYTHTSKGLEVKGVFVKEIVSGSPADHCGKVRESDMIINIAGHSMLGASLEDAARVLKQSGNIVRLKIGRTFSRSKEDGENDVLPDIKNPYQEENERLKAELTSVKDELEEAQSNNVDLTQAIATVTVEKTKLDMQIKTLKDKLEKAKASSAVDTSENNAVSNEKTNELKRKIEELDETKASLENELDSAKKEISKLEVVVKDAKNELDLRVKEVDDLKGEAIKLKEEVKRHQEEKEEIKSQLSHFKDEVSQLKADLEKEKKEKDLVTKSLSEKIIALEEDLAHSKELVVVEVAEPSTTKEGNDSKENVTPDSDEVKKSPKKHIIIEPSKEKESTSPDSHVETTTLSTDAMSVNGEGKESIDEIRKSRDVTPITDDEEGDFNEIKSMSRLNSTSALQKSQLSAHMRRKKPTRSHVQSLANLSPFPEEMPSLSTFENDSMKSVSESQLPSVAPKPRARTEGDKTTPVAPKPKPRPQPRKKQLSPDHALAKTPPESPVAAKRPIPVPRTPSHEANTESVLKNDSEFTSSSPKRSPILPPSKPKPHSESPEHSPVTKPKPRPNSEIKSEHNETSVVEPTPEQQLPTPAKKPKPLPSKPPVSQEKSGNEGGLDAKLEAIKRKDPSELTVKEKMMLAQQAMAKQAEIKSKGMPPPIVKKRPHLPPKAESLDIDVDESRVEEREENDGNMERSQSMDDILEEGGTPKRQPRKLPPGAFNIGIPMGLPADNRVRSYTVGSSSSDHGTRSSRSLEDSVEDKQESTGIDATEKQLPQENGLPLEEVNNEARVPSAHSTPQGTPKHKRIENEEVSNISLTPEVSAQDTNSTHSLGDDDDNPDDGQVDETIESNEALLETEATRTSTSSLQPDAEQVLYWSPDVVGIWLSSIGLGQYAHVVKDREIKGYMMFDLDSGRLKGMGMSSDDRKVFAKELKTLKPFAEKLKKEHDKQKKEEKKRLEQEKKLAKKKKK